MSLITLNMSTWHGGQCREREGGGGGLRVLLHEI